MLESPSVVPQKECDCGRGTIYTERGENFNPRIDGYSVCDECFAEYLRDKYSLDGE